MTGWLSQPAGRLRSAAHDLPEMRRFVARQSAAAGRRAPGASGWTAPPETTIHSCCCAWRPCRWRCRHSRSTRCTTGS